MAYKNDKTLSIGFDLRYLQAAYRNSPNGGKGGMGVYARGLWQALARLFPDTELVALVDHGPLPGNFYDLIKLSPRHKIIAFGLAGSGTILSRLDRGRYSWITRALESECRLGIPSKSICFDVLHILNQSPAPLSGICPSIVTIYDLVTWGVEAPLEQMLWGKLHRKYSTLLRRADRLVCISESTRKDVALHLIDDKNKTEVIYPGIDLDIFKPGFTNKEEIKDKFGISTDYFIHVGVCSDRKNPHALLNAITIAIETTQKDFVFVFVGPYQVNKKALDTISQVAEKYGITNRIVILGDVTDTELATLYRNALALVFPSLYEGFGYPAVECLACGTQCIVSSTSSLPEAVGELGILVDPTNVQQIAAAMISIVNLGKSQMIQLRGPRWAQKFSWGHVANAYMKIYQELAGNGEQSQPRKVKRDTVN